jgi:SEC-C motif-containing protein
MRSRYSAFAIEDADYLSATWHSQTRPQNLSLEPDTHWLRLEIVDSSERGDDGEVTFIATFREKQEWLRLSETSRFIRENGRWYYLDGNASFETFKPGRNDPCPCGSGQKFKKCCG